MRKLSPNNFLQLLSLEIYVLDFEETYHTSATTFHRVLCNKGASRNPITAHAISIVQNKSMNQANLHSFLVVNNRTK
jgi:hypothetical protein